MFSLEGPGRLLGIHTQKRPPGSQDPRTPEATPSLASLGSTEPRSVAGLLFHARPERLPLGWQGMGMPTSVCMRVRVQWVCVCVSVHTRVRIQTCVHVHRIQTCVHVCPSVLRRGDQTLVASRPCTRPTQPCPGGGHSPSLTHGPAVARHKRRRR